MDELRVLVTGANSGLGFAICTRLIDEFLETYVLPRSSPSYSRIALILTTRSLAKSAHTSRQLEAHLLKLCGRAESRSPGAGARLREHVRLQLEQLDLTSLLSVRRLARKLADEGRRGLALDVVICNAGIGGWTGLNWPRTIWTVLTDFPHSVTWPTFKISGVGWSCEPQLLSRTTAGRANGKAEGGSEPNGSMGSKPDRSPETPLGEVFTANVFGHYMLVHSLMPLLRASRRGSRVIWLSSLEAYSSTFDVADLQGMKSTMVYECTKRVTDLLVLSSETKSTQQWVEEYMSPSPRPKGNEREAKGSAGPSTGTEPKFYLSHPGVCATAIFTLPLVLEWIMIAIMYAARWVGSPWHTCSSYKGAVAPVWLALASPELLEQSESDANGKSRKGKWGSAVNIWGHERVARSEVEGWGWAGELDEGAEWRSGMGKRARWKFARDLTEADQISFEAAGREVWAGMEELRKDWEQRLEESEATWARKE